MERLQVDAAASQPALVIAPSDPELQRLLGFGTMAPPPAPAPPLAPDVADVPAATTAPTQTSTPTAAAPRTPVPAPPTSSSQATIIGIITDAADRHGVSSSWMIKIARCESNLNPRAYNPSGPYYGLFQFLLSTFRAHGGTSIWDPVQQSDIAATMLSHGGANAWACA